MQVQFVASVAPIVRDAHAARAFYHDALGLTFEGGGEGGYAYTNAWKAPSTSGSGRCQRPPRRALGRRSGRPRFRFPRPASSSRSPTLPPRLKSSTQRATDSSTTLAPNRGRRSPHAYSALKVSWWLCATRPCSTNTRPEPDRL
jgi:hypothetical protein